MADLWSCSPSCNQLCTVAVLHHHQNCRSENPDNRGLSRDLSYLYTYSQYIRKLGRRWHNQAESVSGWCIIGYCTGFVRAFKHDASPIHKDSMV